MFRPPFESAGERRLIAQMAAPAAAPEGAPAEPQAAELTPKQKEIQEQLEQIKNNVRDNPDAVSELAVFEIARAEEAEEAMQARYHEALTKAANAYYEDLVNLPGETDIVQKVNEAFVPSGVAFQLDAGSGQLTIGPEESAEPEQSELSPQEEQALQDAIRSMPEDIRSAAERVIREFLGDPQMKERLLTFGSAYNELSPDAQAYFCRNAAVILDGRNPDAEHQRNPFMDKIGLGRATPEVRQEIQDFMGNLGPEGQAFVRKLFERFRNAMEQQEQELSEEERVDILQGAKEELQKAGDVSQMAEIDRNILVARLQMRGIDTGNSAEFLTNPDKMKVFDGSPMERGFHKIMGLIGYVLLSIQKLKEKMKPGGNTAPEAAAGQPSTGAETTPGNAELQKKLREEMQTSRKTGDQLLQEKTRRQQAVEQEIEQQRAAAGEDAGETDEDSPQNEALQKENIQLLKEIQELETMQLNGTKVMRSLTEVKLHTLELAGGLPAGHQDLSLINDGALLSLKLNDQYELILDPNGVAGVTPQQMKQSFSTLLARRLAVPSSTVLKVGANGVLENPQALIQAFEQLAQSIRGEIERNNQAPAQAGTPPAAGAPGAAA